VLLNSTYDGSTAANLAASTLLREHIDAALGPHIICNGTDANTTECSVTLEHRALPADLDRLLAVPAVASLGEAQDASFARDLMLAFERELQRLFALTAERMGVTYTTQDEQKRQRDVSAPVDQAVTLTVAVAEPPAHLVDVSTFALQFVLAPPSVDAPTTPETLEAASTVNATTVAAGVNATSSPGANATSAATAGVSTTAAPTSTSDPTTARSGKASATTDAAASTTESSASPTTQAPADFASTIEIALAAVGISATHMEVDVNTSVVRATLHTTRTAADILQIVDAMNISAPGTVTLSTLEKRLRPV
jgi:hypothetical protein